MYAARRPAAERSALKLALAVVLAVLLMQLTLPGPQTGDAGPEEPSLRPHLTITSQTAHLCASVECGVAEAARRAFHTRPKHGPSTIGHRT